MSGKLRNPATFFITRPKEDAEPMMVRLEALGYSAVSWPLFRTEWISDEIERLRHGTIPDAVVISSPRGLRALSMILTPEQRGGCLLATVGKATAAHARRLGFVRAKSLGRTAAIVLKPLASWGPEDSARRRCWYLSGEEITHDLTAALELAGWQVEHQVAYRMVPCSPDFGVIRECLAPVVSIFSQQAAMRWLLRAMAECMAWQDIPVACLSRSIADWLLERGVRSVIAPSQPSLESWYAMVSRQRHGMFQ